LKKSDLYALYNELDVVSKHEDLRFEREDEAGGKTPIVQNFSFVIWLELIQQSRLAQDLEI
jgi:hypothetical protein